MIAKAGLGLLGLGVIGVGGTVLAKPSLFFSEYKPKAATGFAGKWAADRVSYFVDADDKHNEYWWKKRFDEVYQKEDEAAKGKRKTKFQNLNKAFGTDSGSDKFLSAACKAAYGADSTSVVSTDSSVSDGQFLEDNIWKYCSFGGSKPKSIQNESASYTSPQYGAETNVNTKLISTQDKSNQWFWDIKDEQFFGLSTDPITSPDTSTFKGLFDKKNNRGEKDSVKEACERAYKKSKAESDKDQTNILKWCSITGKE